MNRPLSLPLSENGSHAGAGDPVENRGIPGADLAELPEGVPLADPQEGRGDLPDAVDGEHRRALVAGGEEGAGGVAQVVPTRLTPSSVT
jgi:hypothetical protein